MPTPPITTILTVPSTAYSYVAPNGFEADMLTHTLQGPFVVGTVATVSLRIDVRSLLTAPDPKDTIDGLTSVLISITVPHATFGNDIPFVSGTGSVQPPAGTMVGLSSRQWLVPVVKRLQNVTVGCDLTPTAAGVKAVTFTVQAVQTDNPTVPQSRAITHRQTITVEEDSGNGAA